MIETKQETLVARGNLQQCHLMVLTTAESRFRLGVNAKNVTCQQIFNSTLCFIFIQYDVDFMGILYQWKSINSCFIKLVVYSLFHSEHLKILQN